MFRFLLSFAAVALLILPAIAETDWSRYGSFMSTRCEDEQTISDIRESLKGLTFNDSGRPTFGNASDVTIVRSSTVRANADTLVCRLKMQTFESGQTTTYSVLHTVKIYPDGRWTTQYQPNY